MLEPPGAESLAGNQSSDYTQVGNYLIVGLLCEISHANGKAISQNPGGFGSAGTFQPGMFRPLTPPYSGVAAR